MKRHRLVTSIAGAGMALLSLAAGRTAAQNRDDNGGQQTQEEFHRGTAWHLPLFERVRKDLDRAKAEAFRESDRSRIDHTVLELTELQGDLSEYWYSPNEIDEVVGSLRRVVTENRLGAHDRHILNNDLVKMSDYRERQNTWR